MDVEYNFQPGSSNIIAKELLESRVVITRRSDMFKIINAAYRQLASPITNCVVIKTFMDVEQNRYKCGQDIPFNSKKMTQEAEVHNADKQLPIEKKLPKILAGFPIPHEWLIREANSNLTYAKI